MRSQADRRGHFGIFGGRYVPETLMAALRELELEYHKSQRDPSFKRELNRYLKNYAGRPTPLTHARQLSKRLGGVRVYLKREDLLHTGAHKINNTIGQALLALRMGKKRIIAETGAGQHGVATATVAALFNLTCDVYMGEEDMRRQEINVFRMRLLGSRVIPVSSGSRTLKDAINEAMRDWVTNVDTTHYIIGSVVGPHPYPTMVRDFQSVIGKEARRQIRQFEKRGPDLLVACVGGGSNAIGFFHPFLNSNVRMIGVEAGGSGLSGLKHAATLSKGNLGVLHGSMSMVLEDRFGQIQETHSVSAGLDYPGVGPEHSYLQSCKRVRYEAVTDKIALEGFKLLSETEGIIPALEPAHAVGFLYSKRKQFRKNQIIILCLSGRGDKDIQEVMRFI